MLWKLGSGTWDQQVGGEDKPARRTLSGLKTFVSRQNITLGYTAYKKSSHVKFVATSGAQAVTALAESADQYGVAIRSVKSQNVQGDLAFSGVNLLANAQHR